MRLATWGARAAAVLLLAATGACSSYLARRDTLSDASGDAVAANAAIHVIDPWPAQASRIDRTTSGERAARAIERYRNPATGPGALGAAPPPAGALLQPSAPNSPTGLR